MLQCVAVCCSVLQCDAVCYSVMQCVAVRCSVLQRDAVCCSVLMCVAVCCSVFQCVAVSCSLMQYATCCNMLQHAHTDPRSVTASMAIKHCNALQFTATRYNTKETHADMPPPWSSHTAIHCNPLQHTTTHTRRSTQRCRLHGHHTMQHIATHGNTQKENRAAMPPPWPSNPATHCNTLQYTVVHCSTLQHTEGDPRSDTASVAIKIVSVRVQPICLQRLRVVQMCARVAVCCVCCNVLQCVAVLVSEYSP